MGMHPWEFYEYNLIEFIQKRKGINRRRKDDYQRMLIASMLPYMKKEERVKIVNDAFRQNDTKQLSVRERYEALKKRFEPLTGEIVKRKPKAANGQ
jgi:hypothetical protein